MKLFTKVTVNWLHPAIPVLVDPDQTGFVHGRSIAENFVYAADLTSCCHKRRASTALLKLDFKKVFDSIDWANLDRIMQCRGFDERWRGWRVGSLISSRAGALLFYLTGCQGHGSPVAGGCAKEFPFILTYSSLSQASCNASSNVPRSPATFFTRSIQIFSVR
jgi:hypothetical protein